MNPWILLVWEKTMMFFYVRQQLSFTPAGFFFFIYLFIYLFNPLFSVFKFLSSLPPSPFSRWEESLALTTSIIAQEPHHQAVRELHISLLSELQRKNDLFLYSHQLVESSPSFFFIFFLFFFFFEHAFAYLFVSPTLLSFSF